MKIGYQFLGVAMLGALSGAYHAQPRSDWTQDFGVEPNELSSSGRNPFFILEPGYQLVLEDRAERLVISVLPATRVIDGVETRIVEERETNAGALVEVSRNYFAISRRTNSVYYFGEDVDMYKAGTVTSHEGAWQSGVAGAHFGLVMAGLPLMHGRYYQELAPKIAMDRAEIVSVRERVMTPAGEFKDALRTEETTPLEPGRKAYKLYAAGVGIVQDDKLKLVKYGRDISAP